MLTISRTATLAAAFVVAGVVCFGGCSSDDRNYYKVRDPQSGRIFYTKDMNQHTSGAVTLLDGASSQHITLQNSEVQRITKDMYYAGRRTSGQNPDEVREAEARAAEARAEEARAAQERAAADRAAEERAAQARAAEARAAEERAAAERAAQEQAAAAQAEEARAAEAKTAEAKRAVAKGPNDADAPVAGVDAAAGAAAGKQAASVEQFRENLVSAKDEIDRTLTTLSDLIDPGQTDLAAANKRFGDQVDALRTHAEKVKTDADAMRQTREAYFAKWDARIAAIDNPTLRTEAEAKRARLRNSQETILVDSALVKEAYRPFMADLEDTRKFLAADASKDSVSVLAPTVKKAQENGKVLKERIDKVVESLDEVEGKPAAAPAGSGRRQ